MAHQQIAIVVSCLLALYIGQSAAVEAHWSVCDQYYAGNCKNGAASDDCTFEELKPTGASVKGLFVFFVTGRSGGASAPGLAEFMFQEEFGNYNLFSEETSGNVTCLKRMGSDDYRAPALTLVDELELIGDGANRFFESAGSPDSCLTSYTFKSIAINGAERWEIFGRDGNSVCIQVENTTSLIPGIVRDVRTLGFDIELKNICQVVRGCSKDPAEVIKIPNSERQGVLRR